MAKTSSETTNILLKIILIGILLIIGILIYMIMVDAKNSSDDNSINDNVKIEEPAEADSEAIPTPVNPQVTD